ncbi:TerC family protein [Nonomuraea dietziae]|uniref:TerC family protein n=1 Tax=Nonomuraea dietziae TaxID=65515 RepID=UPI0031D91F08
MWDWVADPQIWIGFFTLVALEIVLGIDNIIFISILAGKLPPEQRDRARVLGLGAALVTRLLLLLALAWVVRLTEPLFEVLGQEISGRDLILILGGLFLLAKSVLEIGESMELKGQDGKERKVTSFTSVILQIMVLDIVFSLDSVITAVGMVDELGVMVAAVIVAVLVMLFASGADQQVRRQAPEHQDARAVVPGADRGGAPGRGLRPAHPEGLHLLRDGLLGGRGAAQHQDAEQAREGGI